MANLALNELAKGPLPDYKALNARYGERFQPQDLQNLQPVSGRSAGTGAHHRAIRKTMTRRDLLRRGAASTLAAMAIEAQETAPAPTSPQLRWLGDAAPPLESGVSWGVPWPRGAVSKSQTFSLTAGGAALPLQQWPLAYWPDGSIKWTGFATVAHTAADFRLAPGAPAAPASPIKVTESAAAIYI